ncbi:hypothetical protein CDD81_1318 [Ophiocordyceps australis]|uniref:Adenosine deaminase domain-containing protein n=1 Tax=Ophiocordyceps australis TaxID=1399860 RepID=A0A2C5XZ89_9HYPO|nr:hypothetical protein CDD81_1318 [Ophiocordyceps australis]
MKGLFNYEKAFRLYTHHFLASLVDDKILYAEIRPNFMESNRLYRDDGSGPQDNATTMQILIDEVTRFCQSEAAAGRYFAGLKVIYCTPRSSTLEQAAKALDECFHFKQRWPHWIAGFDLVGEEARGRPLADFAPQLVAFSRRCAAHNIDIPLLLHCGETCQSGSPADHNLVDALALGARRIGHGFALTRHPVLLAAARAANICVELCPISNEVLGLTPRVASHAMYALLANGLHCAVSSDNAAFFASSLAHDFYQVLIGKADFDLLGWKQLALWSIQHSCIDFKSPDADALLRKWEEQWDEYISWLIDECGPRWLARQTQHG